MIGRRELPDIQELHELSGDDLLRPRVVHELRGRESPLELLLERSHPGVRGEHRTTIEILLDVDVRLIIDVVAPYPRSCLCWIVTLDDLVFDPMNVLDGVDLDHDHTRVDEARINSDERDNAH